METSASCEARYAPLLYPTHHFNYHQVHLGGNPVCQNCPVFQIRLKCKSVKVILAKFQITVDCENADVKSATLDSF